jgi:hypothetical protein
VHRVAEVVARAHAVRGFRMRAGLATGVLSFAAPSRFQRALELLGPTAASHLNWA